MMPVTQTGAFVPRPLSGTSQQALRTGGWADPVRGGELKFRDTANGIAIAFGASTFTTPELINGMPQGTEAINRVGRKINMKSLYLRWQLTCASATTQGGVVRVLIVYDKQANATPPNITDILLVNEFSSPNNLSNRDRFVTLVDVLTQTVGPATQFATAGTEYRKINLETMFNTGSAGTVGDITSGSLWIMVAQNGSALVGNLNYNYRARIKFTDV